MTVTAVNPIRGIIDGTRPVPVPGPVIEEFMPLPGPKPENTGIVPPWLRGIALDDETPGWGLELYDPDNPGLVPDDPNTPVIMDNGNPGIVPPWLR